MEIQRGYFLPHMGKKKQLFLGRAKSKLPKIAGCSSQDDLQARFDPPHANEGNMLTAEITLAHYAANGSSMLLEAVPENNSFPPQPSAGLVCLCSAAQHICVEPLLRFSPEFD